MPNTSGENTAPPGQDWLRQCFELHKQGRLAEAERVYIQLMASQPHNAVALHFFGVLKLQMQQAERGVELIQRALAIQPGYAQAHGSLGKGLEALGRREEAVASYGRVIVLMPDQADALYNRGRLLAELGRLEEALKDYDRSMAVRPLARVALDRAVVLIKLQRTDQALVSLDQAIVLQPDYAVAHYNRGLALMKLQRFEAALVSFDRAIASKTDYAEAFVNRGPVLEELGELNAALASYDRGIVLNPDMPQAYINRGALLAKLWRSEEALACYELAIELWPDFGKAHNNRGNTLRDLNRPAEALAALDKALMLMPGQAQVFCNRGVVLQCLGRIDEALASFDAAIALDPGYGESYFNKSLALLLVGRMSEGWPLYEWRKRLKPPVGLRSYRQPPWRGENIAGKNLFVYSEQGLGDTLQFCRYVTLAAAKGAKVVLSAQNELVRLLRGAKLPAEIIGTDLVPEQFDYHVTLASLPLVCGTTLETIPAAIPYLAAEFERVQHWRALLGNGGFKIGICWQGSRKGSDVAARSFALSMLEPIARLPGTRLISLQKDESIDEVNDVSPNLRIERLGSNFDCGPDAFIDTAAVMMACDLVISADTSVAHLAGALGRPTWLALRFASEWRWLQERSDSPWYPTLALFRQPKLDDWGSVFAAMARKLGTQLGQDCYRPSR